MENETTQPAARPTGGIKLKIGILAAVLLINSATSAFTPALADLSASFPEVSQASVQMILTVGALASMFGALVAGKLQDYLSQKHVLIAGCALQLLGATPILIHDVFGYMYVVALLIGGGCGLLTATIPAAIASCFEGDERTWMLGAKASFQGIGGAALTAAAGMLAVYGWQFAFGIYLFAGVVLVLVGLFMRANTPLKAQDSTPEQAAAEGSSKARIASPLPICLFLCAASMTLMQACLSTNLALHTQGQGIGDTSVSGFAYSLYSIGVIASGVVAPLVITRFERHALTVGYLFALVGMALIGFVPHIAALCVGNFLNGIAYGCIFTRAFALLPGIVRPSLVPKAMSLASVFASLGFAVGPVLFGAVTSVIAGATATTCFVVATVLLALIVITLTVTRFEGVALERANS